MGIFFVISTYASCQITVQEGHDLPTGAGVVRGKGGLAGAGGDPLFHRPLHGSREVGGNFFAGMESLLDIFQSLCYSKNGKDTFHSKKGGPP